jgi:anaerobic selenocysteine-containing dehydrogenase
MNMSGSGLFSDPRVSRRDFLFAAAVGSGAVLGASFAGSVPAYASNKIPQKAVSYQPSPKGNQRCDGCALWQGSSSCKLVDGTIAPSGWCSLFKKK